MTRSRHRSLPLCLALATLGSVPATTAFSAEPPSKQQRLDATNDQMGAVLKELAELGVKPISTLSAEDARDQPTPADAAKALMKKKGMSTEPAKVGSVDNRELELDGMDVPIRVYTPEGDGPFPVVVYYRGGGWVIASLDAYDASCRALTRMTDAVVVSVDYPMAPEHAYPAAHEAAYAALRHVMMNPAEFNGIPGEVAVAGESAGGNLAASVCLMAKEKGDAMPLHQVLVYPVAGVDMNTDSYTQNANAVPLNKPMMKWFFDKYTPDGAASAEYVNLVAMPEDRLEGLPPATVINAAIDPLLSEGQAYAEQLKAAGVDVEMKVYGGVTHEFFGLGALVDEAKQAEQFAAERLRSAFGG